MELMAEIDRKLTPARVRMLLGVLLAVVLAVEVFTKAPAAVSFLPTPQVVVADETGAQAPQRGTFAELIRRDPLAALEQAQKEHNRNVRDYTCTFVKQELLPSGLSDEQTIATAYRQEPRSILMHWVKNPGKAERVIYVKGRWTDPDASNPDEREMAVCQPGAIARMFVKSIKQPIHGSLAREASRRYIDEFGFGHSLELLVKYCRLAKDRGELSLTFKGESEVDGRPTWVVERVLPYTGPNGDYPDRIAVFHIDQEWKVPVSVRCYADDAKTQLLGRYEYSDVALDAGLADSVFEPATYGM